MRITEIEYDVLYLMSDKCFLKPRDFGGYSSSGHSGVAQRLARKGLVEIKSLSRPVRDVNTYKRTRVGTAVLNTERARLLGGS